MERASGVAKWAFTAVAAVGLSAVALVVGVLHADEALRPGRPRVDAGPRYDARVNAAERGQSQPASPPQATPPWKLVVTTEPSGATVSMLDRSVGRTPITVEAPPHASVDLVLELHEYETARVRVTLEQAVSRFHLPLVPVSAPAPVRPRRPPVWEPPLAARLTSEQVRTVVSRERRSVQSCYRRAVQDGLHEDLRITVRLEIAPRGNVTDARAAGGPAAVRDCVRRAVLRWRFPEAGQPSSPEIPFLFTQNP